MNLLIALMTVAAIAMVLTTLSLLILLVQEFNRQSRQSMGVKPQTPRPLNLQNPPAQDSSSREQYQKPEKPTQSSLPLQQVPPSQPPPKQPTHPIDAQVSSQMKPTESRLPLQPLSLSHPRPKQPTHPTDTRVSSQTRTQLIRLAGHDAALADRLAKKVHTDHPDRSAQWCWEKAICDLERDRRT